jgi:hypothetical protein
MSIGDIILTFFVVLGIATSKNFRAGVETMIGGAIVFSIVIAIGIVYTIPYSIVMPVKEKNWRLFDKIWWRAIQGSYTALGDFMKIGFAYRYDELANVWGEWVEDTATHVENTSFGEERTTLSASIGFLEYYKLKMTKSAKGVSKALNWVFNQTRHAIGSWEKKLRLIKLEEENLHGNMN